VDSEFTVGAVTVHAFDIGFDELARDLGVLFDIIAPRGDAAERVVKAVLAEIDQIFAAMPDRVDALRRRADHDIDFTAEQRFELGFGGVRYRLFAQPLDARRVQFCDDELNHHIANPAVADRADSFSCQFLTVIYTRPPEDDL